MEKVTCIDELDIYKVSIRTENFIEIGGIKYKIGETHRRAYSNSIRDRETINNELPEPFLSAVMSIWGDIPTVKIEFETR